MLTEVTGAVSARVLLVMPSLAPALAANLCSADEHVSSSATSAMNTLVAEVPASQLLQSLAHVITHCSNTQGKAVLVEQLVALTPQVRCSTAESCYHSNVSF